MLRLPMKHPRTWPLAHPHKRRRLTYTPCGPRARAGELTYHEVLAEQRATATWRRRGRHEGRSLRQRLSRLLIPTAPSPSSGGMLMKRVLGWLPRALRSLAPGPGGEWVGVGGSIHTAATPVETGGFVPMPDSHGGASAESRASEYMHQSADHLWPRDDG